MPVTLVQYLDENVFFGVWSIEETLQDLQGRWSFNEKERLIYEGFRTDSRRLQWLAYRLLLRSLLSDERLTISYDTAGKPYLEEHAYHISVTHTLNYAAAAVCKTGRVGIDIESTGRNLSKIASKFCSEKEIRELGDPPDPLKMTLFWCAKEALYKLYGLKQLDFRQHIEITNLNPSLSNQFTGTIINPCNQPLPWPLPNQGGEDNSSNPCKIIIPLHFYHYENLVIVIAAENISSNSR